MPELIYVAPNQAHYGMTAAQYGKLIATLRAEPGADNLKVDGFTGSVSYDGVDFSWSYSPHPADNLTTPALTVTIVRKHGIEAKLLPNDAIFARLQSQLLAQIESGAA
jgi:hypothetical protein